MRAGISGMGFGGINCHITLASYGAPNEKFASNSTADAMLTRDYRAPFVVPPAGQV